MRVLFTWYRTENELARFNDTLPSSYFSSSPEGDHDESEYIPIATRPDRYSGQRVVLNPCRVALGVYSPPTRRGLTEQYSRAHSLAGARECCPPCFPSCSFFSCRARNKG